MYEKMGRTDSQSGIAVSKAMWYIFVRDAFKLLANFSTNLPSHSLQRHLLLHHLLQFLNCQSELKVFLTWLFLSLWIRK